MNRKVSDRLWRSFLDLLSDKEKLKDYHSYYSALVSFIKVNKKYFDQDVIKRSDLEFLIELDPKDYITDNPEVLSLDMEVKRLGGDRDRFRRIYSLAMSISRTLWDLVTIWSGIDCPNCIYNELKFFLVEDVTTKEEEIILECEGCGWAANPQGAKWGPKKVNVKPANKKDLERFGIDIETLKQKYF